jgi:hypothetical protein
MTFPSILPPSLFPATLTNAHPPPTLLFLTIECLKTPACKKGMLLYLFVLLWPPDPEGPSQVFSA